MVSHKTTLKKNIDDDTTKGTAGIAKLRFTHEIRKVKVAQKHFDSLDLDYRVIDGTEITWYEKKKINSNCQLSL